VGCTMAIGQSIGQFIVTNFDITKNEDRLDECRSNSSDISPKNYDVATSDLGSVDQGNDAWRHARQNTDAIEFKRRLTVTKIYHSKPDAKNSHCVATPQWLITKVSSRMGGILAFVVFKKEFDLRHYKTQDKHPDERESH
jgi:hypothetical protein